jgi:hypothetical protein
MIKVKQRQFCIYLKRSSSHKGENKYVSSTGVFVQRCWEKFRNKKKVTEHVVRIYIDVYVCIFVYIRVYILLYMCVYMYVCMNMSVYIYTCIHEHICIYTYLHTCKHVSTVIY